MTAVLLFRVMMYFCLISGSVLHVSAAERRMNNNPESLKCPNSLQFQRENRRNISYKEKYIVCITFNPLGVHNNISIRVRLTVVFYVSSSTELFPL